MKERDKVAHVSQELDSIMSVVYAPAQHQLPCGDGLFRGGYQSPLLDPMGYPIKVHGRISFAIDTANGRSRLVKGRDSTTRTSW